MMSEARQFTIEAVDVEVVRPVRRMLLRPGESEDAVLYESDADESSQHFAAKASDGQVIGVGSLHFEDRRAGLEPFVTPGMRIRGMAVEDAWRGQGVGAGLLRRMLEVGREAGIHEAWANARSANLGFYERSGFRGMSSEFEIPGIGPHVVMACTIAEKGARKGRKKKAKPADLGEDVTEPAAD